jgi:hypothetical protein
MTPRAGPGSSPRGREPSNFAEFVRLALHAAADQVEPRADGLAPIRARILAGAGVPWPRAFAISQYWRGPKLKARCRRLTALAGRVAAHGQTTRPVRY